MNDDRKPPDLPNEIKQSPKKVKRLPERLRKTKEGIKQTKERVQQVVGRLKQEEHTLEFKNLTYWIGHFFVVLSTVIGVYLASSEGFRIAVDFDYLKSIKTNYYSAQALTQEFQTNISKVSNYVKHIDTRGRPGKTVVEKHHIKFNEFVWNSLIESGGGLELPLRVLSNIEQIYKKIEKNMDEINRGSGGYPDDEQVKIEEIKKILSSLDEQVISPLKKFIENSKNILIKNEVPLTNQ